MYRQTPRYNPEDSGVYIKFFPNKFYFFANSSSKSSQSTNKVEGNNSERVVAIKQPFTCHIQHFSSSQNEKDERNGQMHSPSRVTQTKKYQSLPPTINTGSQSNSERDSKARSQSIEREIVEGWFHRTMMDIVESNTKMSPEIINRRSPERINRRGPEKINSSPEKISDRSKRNQERSKRKKSPEDSPKNGPGNNYKNNITISSPLRSPQHSHKKYTIQPPKKCKKTSIITQKRQYKISKLAKSGKCANCGERNTPQWRRYRHIDGRVCNSCGSFFAKLTKNYGDNDTWKIIQQLRKQNISERALRGVDCLISKGTIVL